MALSDTKLRKLKPKAKPYKVFDEKGLFLNTGYDEARAADAGEHRLTRTGAADCHRRKRRELARFGSRDNRIGELESEFGGAAGGGG